MPTTTLAAALVAAKALTNQKEKVKEVLIEAINSLFASFDQDFEHTLVFKQKLTRTNPTKYEDEKIDAVCEAGAVVTPYDDDDDQELDHDDLTYELPYTELGVKELTWVVEQLAANNYTTW